MKENDMDKKPKDLYRKRIGAWGENEAEKYLLERGLRVIEHNFRTNAGEIDLIAEENGETVFVEVKTRTGQLFGFPEETITEEKLEHLVDSAEIYLEKNPGIIKWRFDVLSIVGKPGCPNLDFEWFKDVS